MSLRRLSLPLLLAALAAALVALPGCGGSSASTDDASPADVTPKSAVFYGEAVIRPTGDLKRDFDAAAAKIAPGKDLGALIEQNLQKSLAKKDTGHVDYRKDVKPWLGKRAAIFVTGVHAGKPDFGVLISTTDGDKAASALEKSHDDGQKHVERSYHGQKYTYSPSDGSAQAVVDGWLLAGTEPAFRQTVDAIKKKGSGLASTSAYRTARSKVSGKALASFYVDSPRLIDVIAQSGGPQAAIAVGQLRSLPQFSALKPTAAAVTADGSAIRVEAPSQVSQTRAAARIAGMPGNAWLAASSPSLGGRLRSELRATEKLPGGASIQQFKGLLRQQTGLDLDRDLLDWIGGVSFVAGGTGVLDLYAAAIIDSNDPGASAAAVKKIGRLVQRTGRRITTVPGGFAVQIPRAPGPLTVAARGNEVVVAYGRGTVNAVLSPKGRLAASPQYRSAQAALGGGRPGFLLSMPAVLQLVRNFGGGSSPKAQRVLPYLRAITSLAAGTTTENGQKLARLAAGLR